MIFELKLVGGAEFSKVNRNLSVATGSQLSRGPEMRAARWFSHGLSVVADGDVCAADPSEWEEGRGCLPTARGPLLARCPQGSPLVCVVHPSLVPPCWPPGAVGSMSRETVCYSDGGIFKSSHGSC